MRLGLKIGQKLPLLMALITIAALYLAELITTTNARATILAAGEDRLLAVASSRAAEVQGVLASVRADMRAKANNPVILEAARAFKRSWDREGPLAAERLRAAYMVGRDHPVGGELSAPRPNTHAGYHRTHSFYHPFFSSHAASRDYADLYLVSPTGRVIYSVAKGDSFGADVATTLDAGDGLRLVFDRVVNGNGFSVDIMTDFEPYGADPSERSAFFGMPVRDGLAQLHGVLIIRLPAAALTDIVGRSDGLGRTGRAAVLGADLTPRAGLAISIVDADDPVPPERRLAREGGVTILGPEDEEPHLAAFVPFVFQGKRFVVVALQQRSEILASATRLRRESLQDGISALALVCVVGVMLARSISGPLQAVGQAMGQVARRDYDVEIPGRQRPDEIGDIARRLDVFRASLVAADATEREHAFKSAAFEATSAALMLIDRDMTIIYVNQCLVHLMAQHRIALERNVSDFRPDALPGRGLIALYPGAERLRVAAVEGQGNAEMQLGHSHLALAMAPVRAGDSPQILGYVVEWKDVTRRRLSDAVTGAVHATLPVASFSPDGRLIEANPPFLRWTSIPGQAVYGEHWNAIFHANQNGTARPWAEIAKMSAQQEGLWVHPKGGVRLSAMLCRVNNNRGRTRRFVLIAGSDIGASDPPTQLSKAVALHQEVS